MSKRKIATRYMIWAACAGVLLALTLGAGARPQNEKAPASEGPKKDASETVLAPKKPTPPSSTTTAPGGAAQPGSKVPEKINPNEIFTLTTATNLVNVDVLVTDANGNPIPGLGKANFKLADEGVPQSITNFATGNVPMTVCLLIEFSNTYWSILYTAVSHSAAFVQVMEPKDWVAVVTYDMNSRILTDFTQNRQEVLGAISQLVFPGFSEVNFYDAVAFTINSMKDIQGRKAIIALSTGRDTFSKLTYDEFLKLVRNSDTVIYPVSILEMTDVYVPGGFSVSPQARATLMYTAKYSGGQAYFPRFESEMPGIYQQIAYQLRNQYSLGFIPSNVTRDGKFRKLKIELVDVNGNPLKMTNQKGKAVKYKIVSREGYYAPKS